MEQLNLAVKLKQELDDLGGLTPEIEKRLFDKFRLDWNFHSNKLEGNLLTYGETKALILHGITAQGKPLKDHFEITGHDEGIKWIYEIVNKDRDITENFIRELHTLILKKDYQIKVQTAEGLPTTKTIKVGKYKTLPNHVLTKTGEMFYFASPEETPAKMHDLMKWLRDKRDKTNPILLAAEFHYKFIRIHPFDDGNGRIARLLMNFILMQFKYPPVIIKGNDKANYLAALEQADGGNIEPFMEFISKNLNYSLNLMLKAAKGEPFEDEDDLDKEFALLDAKLEKKEKKKTSFLKKILNSLIK